MTAVEVVTLATETVEVVVMAATVSVLVMTVEVPSVMVVVTAVEIGAAMTHYLEKHLKDGGRLHQVTRHMFGLFAGQPGARHWRRRLSDIGSLRDAGMADYFALLEEIKSITRFQTELETA